MNIWKVDNGLYRGPSPILPEDWRQLASVGVNFALDLETGSRLFLDGNPLQEQLLAEKMAIRSFSLPLGEILPPARCELQDSYDFIQTHPNTYVHCKAGVDRTGMVIAYYRIRQGWVPARAIREMWSMGMHPWYFYWAWSLE